jgi:hypothetical protein
MVLLSDGFVLNVGMTVSEGNVGRFPYVILGSIVQGLKT